MTATEWVRSIVRSEKEIYDEGIMKSILSNEFNKNLFCIFQTQDEVFKYLTTLNQPWNDN